MDTKDQEPEYPNNNVLSVLVGLLVGGLAGAVTMLLMAPQSGQATRMQIQEKGIELRDHTTEMVGDMVDDIVAEVRSDRKKITMGGRQKAQDLFEQGQALVIEQLDHVSDAAKAGKKAIQNA